MIPANIQLVVHYVMIIGIEKFVATKAQIRYAGYGNQSQSNTREIYYTTHLYHDRPRGSRSSTHLPITFKAPDVGSRNFWNYNEPNPSDRRMFLGDLGYFNYGKPNLFPNLNSFFEFMNPLLGKANHFTPAPPIVPKAVSEPYRYEYPFNIRPTTDRNFLPPPKPIRASIVKLETVTRPPEPFDYVNLPENPPKVSDFKPIPPETPISLYIDELGFHSAHNVNFERHPGRNSRPGVAQESPTPNFTTDSTIYIPSSAEINHQRVRVISETRQRLATNDKHNDTETSGLKPIFAADEKTKNKLEEESGNNTFPVDDVPPPEAIKYSNGRRTGGKNDGTNVRAKLHANESIVKYDDSKSGNVDEAKSVQTSNPYRSGNSIKIVTELTLEGLSKNDKQPVNIPRFAKIINSSLINYELNKLKQNKILIPRSDVSERNKNEFVHPTADNFSFSDVNANDELSLDLKILKDTNWDGFITETSRQTQNGSTIYNSTETGNNSEKPGINTENGFYESRYSDKRNNLNNTPSDENEKASDNKTIIVETRVTKSVTKTLPLTHRQIIKRINAADRGRVSLLDMINKITSRSNNSADPTFEGVNSKNEIPLHTNKQKDDNSSESAATNNTGTINLFKETNINQEKNLKAPKYSEITDILRRSNASSRFMLKKIPKKTRFSSNDTNEDVFGASDAYVNNTNVDVTKNLNFDLENNSSNGEKSDTHNMETVTEKQSQNIAIKAENGTTPKTKYARKRKPKKRQKLKRRLTGRRRQNHATTTEETINNRLTNMETTASE